jgi:hypothetical protein
MSDKRDQHDHQSIREVLSGRWHPRTPLRYWDDGLGPVWLYRETLGPVGVVRAQTWEDAYECVIDEIMDDADLDDLDLDDETGELPEGCYWRGSGEPSCPDLHCHVAASDLNGSSLDRLTAELAREYGILIRWEE